MSELKATPGPWETSLWRNLFGVSRFSVCAGPGSFTEKTICERHASENNETVMANMTLIAAAPELYSALNALVQECGVIDAPEGNLLAAIEALAKARGES